VQGVEADLVDGDEVGEIDWPKRPVWLRQVA